MKNGIIFFAGLLIGIILTTGILFDQIQNRYIIGQNHGVLEGQRKVLNFINENVKNDLENGFEDKGKYLPIKEAGLKVIKINGIETIGIIE